MRFAFPFRQGDGTVALEPLSSLTVAGAALALPTDVAVWAHQLPV
jgi:hypothetical protein